MRSAPTPCARLIRLVLCLSLLAQSLLPTSAGAAGRSAGKSLPTASRAPAGKQVEAMNLPDLDEARRRPRHEPKAVPPVPSTRRRCPPRNPRCNEGATGAPQATPTPAPQPSPRPHGNPHALAAAASVSFPSLMGAAFGDRAPLVDQPLLDFYSGGGYSVSDAPARLMPPAAYAAAPAPFFQQGGVNVAAAASGATAQGSTSYDAYGLHASNAINGSRSYSGSYWNDQTANSLPDWLQVNFAGAKTIGEVGVFFLQDNYGTAEPTESMTFTQFGVTSFEVQYWTGSQWAAVPGGVVTGNSKVWRKFTFAPITTDRIRIIVNAASDGWSRIVEVEAYLARNVAAAANGATAVGSTSYDAYGLHASNAINGSRSYSGSYWNDQTANSLPDWLQVNFSGTKTLGEVGLFFLQDNYGTTEPTEAMTFTQFGVTSFDVQYWTGSQWANVPGGAVTGNNKVWRKFTFPAVTTDKIRVVVNGATDGWSRIVEVEAYEGDASQLPPGTGLTGEYYDNIDFTNHVMTRADAAVNFDWAGGSPSPAMGGNEFSVRWTGTVVPLYTQDYTFHATTDDGVRLWIDGRLVINRWQDQAPYEEASTPLPLVAGRHYAVRMEYYEHGGGAMAWLKWSSLSQAQEVIPQSRLYGCWKGADQFVKDFHQGALGRQPSAAELQDWAVRLNQAQDEDQLLAEAQGLGAQLFKSTEYAGRGRTDSEYVSDLYLAYLQRAPDSGGLTHWTNQIAQCGSDQACREIKRADVRLAFGESLEFTEKVRNLCGTSAASPAHGGAGYNFSTARLDPSNRTGGGGADAYSRNFNFQIPLVSLPGRAGLDLGLTLSYNSLVWTKDATGVTFDADEGFPSPGFRLGFPTIQQKFHDPRTRKYAYLLLTPGGARVELRETAAAGVYEAADSSYLRLTEGDMTLRSADGTRLSFVMLNGSYRCHQVKDRNGNYLSVIYHGDGRIDRVIDTLGRAVTFNYDVNLNLNSITQPRKRETEENPAGIDETHEWATFGYVNRELQPQFSDLAVIGEQPGTVIPVIRWVGLGDGSYYSFEYNGWGQVWKVTRHAAVAVDAQRRPTFTHPLTSTRLGLPGAGVSQGGAPGVAALPQTDCPRFRELRTWVEYGVMGQSGEVVTKYDEWAADMASCEVTLPDNMTKQVSTYATSADGWMKGLTTKEEVFSGTQSVRTTTLSWEHDGGTAPYPTNPRVTQTTVSDPQASGRTTRVTYTTPADFKVNNGYAENLNLRLPRKVEECTAGCSAVLRTVVTDYSVPNLGEYVGRRVLGLARYQYLYEGAEAPANLRSKVEHVYDEPNDDQDTFLAALPTPAFQHDAAAYGQTMAWRGNANRVRRYSVNQTTGAVGGYVESRAAFNVTGTLAYAKDASDHKSSVSYTDSFFQNVNRTHPDPQQRLQTYAYPTTVTDPDNFTATTSYNYDMGAARETRTPLPNVKTNQAGPLSRVYYDAAGRMIKSLNVDTGAYTHVIYPAKMDLVETYTLVEAGKEARSVQVLDGAGRARASSRYLPPLADSGTGVYSGNYSGQQFDYDELGRLVGQTNPAEVTASWALAGGDSWVYTRQTYDWKGRPLVMTREADGSRFEYQYGGCGCAGGQTVSTRDEVGRRRRVTYDVTGRTKTIQVFMQQSTSVEFTISATESPYSTVTTTYDALGRVREVKERAGAAGAEQLTTTEYDGHGRVWRRRLPQYEVDKYTTYAYNDDDTVASVTDPRGAVAAYSYEGNNRHLVESITHTLAGSDTLEVTFEYDAAGNRKKMDDGPGWVAYEYDALSRLRKESRHFDALSGNAHNPYELSYTYTPSGQLKTVTDPFDSAFTYEFDRAGQLREVTGSAYAGVATYARDVQYRAWGGVKSASFGDGAAQTTSYDARMRPWEYRLTGGGSALREDFTYYADGRLQRITDLDDGTRQTSPRYHTMSRVYTYDHVGRVKEAGGHAPAEPGGNTGSPNWPSPYVQSYNYDEFGSMTSRLGTYGYRTSQTDTSSYVNNRRQGWDYDAGGRVTHSTPDPANPSSSSERTWTYDAAGRLVTTTETAAGVTRTLTQAHDGDGRLAYSSNGSTAGTDYEVRSSVLGGEVVTRLTQAGGKGYTYVPAGGLVRPRQTYNSSNQEVMQWSHLDPVGVTESGLGGPAAYDPLGNYAGLPEPPPPGQAWPQPGGYYGPIWGGAGSLFSNANNFSMGCRRDGAPADCRSVLRDINNGQAGSATISTTGGADSLFAAGLGGATSSLVSGYVHPRRGIIIPKPGVKLTFDRDGSLWRAATFLVPGSQLSENGDSPQDHTGPGRGNPEKRKETPGRQPCDPDFFSGGVKYTDTHGNEFTGTDLNQFGRLIYAESSNHDEERAAVGSVIYNRVLDGPYSSFNGLANSGQFEAVTGDNTRAWDRTAPEVAKNLSEADCNALRSAVHVVRSILSNGPRYPEFRAFRGGTTPLRDGITLIGGSRFAASDDIFNPPPPPRRR